MRVHFIPDLNVGVTLCAPNVINIYDHILIGLNVQTSGYPQEQSQAINRSFSSREKETEIGWNQSIDPQQGAF
jgi:hypothetical protein